MKDDEKEKKEGRCAHSITSIAWEMLVKKMEKLNLSEAEQELIKQDILHKEAEPNRKM